MTDILEDVRIGQLVADSRLQPRVNGLEEDHVQALMESSELPPVTVVLINGRKTVIDGHHTIEACRRRGDETIAVRIVDPPPDGDLLGFAFQLNKTHGLPPSVADRRAEAKRTLQRHPEYADRVVARAVGLSPTTVATVRRDLKHGGGAEVPAQRVGAGGYRYTPPARERGELPAPSTIQQIGDLFTPRDKARQRRIARYFERLAVALEDQFGLGNWEFEDAASACNSTLGADGARDLADRLGPAAENVLEVATMLGYDPDAHDERSQ